MPDRWQQEVRARLSSLRLSPTREAEIVEELSQHLDDRYGELIRGLYSEAETIRVMADIQYQDGRHARINTDVRVYQVEQQPNAKAEAVA